MFSTTSGGWVYIIGVIVLELHSALWQFYMGISSRRRRNPRQYSLKLCFAPSAMIPEMGSSATTRSQGIMLCSITLRRWLHTDGSL